MGKGAGLCFSSKPPPTETIRGTKQGTEENSAEVLPPAAAEEQSKPAQAPAAAPAPPAPVPASAPTPAVAAAPAPSTAPAAETPAPVSPEEVVTSETSPAPSTTRVAIIYYSLYGHVAKLAQAVKSGVEEIPGIEVSVFQVAETLSEEVLAKMHAPPKDSSVPFIDASTLADYDGYVFGFPTRFGMMAAQFKAFLDATGQIWMKGGLVGKPAGLFTSTASQGGGQETTLMSAVTYLAHQGMVYVPTGYATGGGMYDVQVARGGSPWGAGTLAGADGSRQPSDIELLIAKTQGKQLATVAKKLKAAT